MAELEGTYLQTPPPYCAKKIGGVKYYELARRGEEVPLEPKEVTVYGFELQPAKPAESGDSVDSKEGEIAFLRVEDRESTRLNSRHLVISYAVFCLKKKKKNGNRDV